VFIIAEIGINHNGSTDLAKKLIKLAKDCGCDAVKFQKRTIDTVYTKEYLNKPRESPWGKTQRAQKYGLEFNKRQFKIIDDYCKELGIDWFASAWDVDSQVFLDQFDLKYNKIASPMLTHDDLLEHVAKQGKKTFISTGMSSWKDIDKAVNIFRAFKCPFVLMHCTSIYPCPVDKLDIKMVETLKKRYNCDVGYSGHSPGFIDSVVAASIGAKYIEKHITLDRAMYGSDQAASMERRGMELTVKNCKLIDSFMGDGKLKLYPEEEENLRKLRYW